MDNKVNRSLNQYRSCSLIDCLLGDDTHLRWLENRIGEQGHRTFAAVELSCPGYPVDQTRREVAENSGRGVWHGDGVQSEFGVNFKRLPF